MRRLRVRRNLPLVFRPVPCQIFGKAPSYPVGSPWGFRRLGRSRCTHQSGKDLLLARLCAKAFPSARSGQDSPFRIRHTPCRFRYGTGNSRCAPYSRTCGGLTGNSLGYIKVISAQRIRSKGNWTRRHRPAALFSSRFPQQQRSRRRSSSCADASMLLPVP